MDDHPMGAAKTLVRALDEIGATLREDLDCHVVRHKVLFDELANEVKVRL